MDIREGRGREELRRCERDRRRERSEVDRPKTAHAAKAYELERRGEDHGERDEASDVGELPREPGGCAPLEDMIVQDPERDRGEREGVV